MTDLHIGLCAARHPMPVTDFVFPNTISNPMDFEGLTAEALEWIENQVIAENDAETCYLYVTGLTSALTSFLLAWQEIGLDLADQLVLMHYDRSQDIYLPQEWY